jgi:predicted nucleotidyltransferase
LSPRSIHADRPVDPIAIEILRAVAAAANDEEIDHMLVGATARDVLLTHVFGLTVTRATRDLDFAVAVKDWDQFDALRAALLARNTFKDAGNAKQRLYYQGDNGAYHYPIDLVPFGAITKGSNEIAWPPDLKTIMNVAGYEDVLVAAELVEICPGFIQKVVSIAGLAILKIVAWSDRGREDPKDAQDLVFIMDSYTAAGNFNRVYEVGGVIEAGDYDPDLAGVYLLGLDIRQVASENTRDMLEQIIERDFDRLVNEMIRPLRHFENVEDRVASRLRLLQQALV